MGTQATLGGWGRARVSRQKKKKKKNQQKQKAEAPETEPEEVVTVDTDEAIAAFQAFDLTGDGFISREEFIQGMETLGEIERLTAEALDKYGDGDTDSGAEYVVNEIDKMLAEADLNKDGVIDYQEFV